MDIEATQANHPKYFFDDLKTKATVRLVIGGTKNREEIKRKQKLLMLINELKDRKQVVEFDLVSVDEAERKLISRIDEIIGNHPRECDDLHIFALARVSGCVRIISRDARMARCRNLIRNRVGHDCCPNIRVLQNEGAYRNAS